MKEYKHFGVMVDCSRNAVMSVSAIKRFIDCLQKMHYNMLELYTEDTFEVDGEPYFGYLRGRYTSAEIKEMDAYAAAHGIELIPCIQTLAHFTNPAKLPRFEEIIDVADILLIDEPKTYEFIERIFASLAKNFTSRNVNIGMDEAMLMGLGKYLKRNGYCDHYELLNKHLRRVVQIAEKYGFKAHMWSDMYFRPLLGGEHCGRDVYIPENIRKSVPEQVALTYWDYYHTEQEDYDSMMRSHKEFGNELWFAGGAWTWLGFVPRTRFTYRTMKLAMRSVQKYKVENVFITMWGDNGGECSKFSLLQALYAIRRYADGEYDDNVIAEEFFKLFGIRASNFDLLELPDRIPQVDDSAKLCNASKFLLYADPFLGIPDMSVSKYDVIPYGNYAKALQKAKTEVGEYSYIFDTLEKLCKVLEIKAYLGARTRDAYGKGDKSALHKLTEAYSETIKRIDEFFKAFSVQWHKDNKPFGFEVQCQRIGGLKERLAYCKSRIVDYLDGGVKTIPELEEKLLPYYPYPDHNDLFMGEWQRIVSACGI